MTQMNMIAGKPNPILHMCTEELHGHLFQVAYSDMCALFDAPAEKEDGEEEDEEPSEKGYCCFTEVYDVQVPYIKVSCAWTLPGALTLHTQTFAMSSV